MTTQMDKTVMATGNPRRRHRRLRLGGRAISILYPDPACLMLLGGHQALPASGPYPRWRIVGLTPFKKQFGYLYNGEYVVSAAWNGASNYAFSIGGVVGTLFAGWVYDWFEPKTTLACSYLGNTRHRSPTLAPRCPGHNPAGQHRTNLAQCSLILLCLSTYDITIGPTCVTVLTEIPAVQLRGMAIGLATVACHAWNIIFSISIHMRLTRAKAIRGER
ncbi:hypothetical protein BDV10DRAFT_184560 [Aspergillus recurvatus]